jgi:hypothetical protein
MAAYEFKAGAVASYRTLGTLMSPQLAGHTCLQVRCLLPREDYASL